MVQQEDTLVHHSAKDIDPAWGGGTVPAAIPELVLALSLTATCVQQSDQGTLVSECIRYGT